MSRGLGRVQVAVLAVLTEFEPRRLLRSTEMAMLVVGHDHPSQPEHNAVCRALVSLQRKGLADVDKKWRRWGTSAAVQRWRWVRPTRQRHTKAAVA